MIKSSTLVLLLFAVIVLFVIPYTRNEMKKGSGMTVGLVFKFLLIFVKTMWNDHVLIVRNLISPRKLIYPSLENEDQVNRNV